MLQGDDVKDKRIREASSVEVHEATADRPSSSTSSCAKRHVRSLLPRQLLLLVVHTETSAPWSVTERFGFFWVLGYRSEAPPWRR